MLFNSLEFIIFLPIVFLVYWFIVQRNLKLQNFFLLAASYFFYGWWDWRFLLLLIFLALSNYSIGLLISKYRRKDRFFLITGLLINLGTLVYFKYYNFFVSSFVDLISSIGYTIKSPTINVILPLGISFYTFLSISYIVDIYKNKIDANRNIIEVLLSLSFFPIILAGPIERPSSLIPQLKKIRRFDYNTLSDGMRQILWGLFTKIVIADNLPGFTNEIFTNYSNLQGSTLLLGAILYAIQIYADFAGYSDIAIGTAKLFGFKLVRNFAYPYFSRDITVFWKRWHISLTNWFRDYVFLPIAYSVSKKIKKDRVLKIKTDYIIYIIGIILTWLLTGLWHGANYTFIIWGLLHGFFLIIYHIQKKPRKKFLKKIKASNNNILIVSIESIITFFIVVITWIFFNSNTVSQAFSFIKNMVSGSLFSLPELGALKIATLILIFIFLTIEWMQREKQHALYFDNIKMPLVLRWAIYLSVFYAILIFGAFNETEFIYFAF